MDNNVVLTGRMDQVNRLGPGEEEIVDYKTGRPRNEDKAKKDVQLSVYALAAREVFDWNPARLTLHFLQTNQPVSGTRYVADADGFVDVAAEHVKALLRAGCARADAEG